MPKETPITPDEKQRRIDIIKNLIVAGHTKAEIVAKCLNEHAFNVTERMCYYYVQDAWHDLSADAPAVDRRAYFMVTVQQLDGLIGEAIKSKNLKAANDLLQTRIRIMKLDTPQAEAWEADAIAAGFNPDDLQREWLANRMATHATVN